VVRSTADVVIVGGGIVGASVAWHLTKAGCRDVVILERESHQGKGSTGKSMGGVRAQFALEADIRMSLHSIAFFRDFERITGHPSGYRPQGYLFLATSEHHVKVLAQNRERQLAAGLANVQAVSRQEILAMVPQLRADDIRGGNFCATDGFVDPHSVMTGFSRGIEIERDAAVTGINVDGRGITGVRSALKSIATRTVVNAAGPWAAEIARMAGAELPVQPLRRMLVPTEPFDKVTHDAPMTVDMSTGFHFRPEGRGFLLAWADPEESPGFRTDVDRGFVEKILMQAGRRVPAFQEVQVNPARVWAGLYEMTPDHHPILGRGPVEGLYFANGFSGHGVMHSPATGLILADLIVKGSTDLIDPRMFDYARFAENRRIEDAAVL
jgi:sarcosine oxidase subunit beta